jgi:23S rRNA (uracil1939-C5)-methyltransferase
VKSDAGFEAIVGELQHDGTVVLRTPAGKSVQARGVLPGERVRVGRTEKRGAGLRALDVVVLDASDARVAAPCAFVDRCGGCSLMHASETFSDGFKLGRVKRALAAFGVEPEIVTPSARLGYRTRARLAFARQGERAILGYREASGVEIVDVARCVVLAPPLEPMLEALRARLAPLLVGRGELRLGVLDARGVVFVETKDAQPAAVYSMLAAMVAEEVIAGAALLAGGATVPARFGALHERTTDLDGRALDLPLGGFSQAHGEHNRALAEHVLAMADVAGKRVLELFAGHGNFSLPLAARAASLTAVELEPGAVACLRSNLAQHGLAARVLESDAGAAMKAAARNAYDVIVLDPPREGAHEVARALPGVGPERVVYVSCDPISLGRDLAILAQGGYAVDAVRAFDMFPQTAHVEVVARLTRAPGARSGGTAPVAAPKARR